MLKVFEYLGIVFGIMSLVLLVEQGFDVGFSSAFGTVVDQYESSMDVLFGPAEPFLTNLLESTGFDLELHPHWKHVLVIMSFYFGAVARVLWRFYKTQEERFYIALLTTWGLLLAFAASLGAGSIEVDDALSNVLMAVFPIAGFVLYQFGWAALLATLGHQERWWIRFRAAVNLYIGRRVIGVIAAALVLVTAAIELPIVKTPQSPGLVLLLGLVVALALFMLWTGAKGVLEYPKAPEWANADFRSQVVWTWNSWRATGNTRIGLSMLATLSGALLFVVAGAGLS